MKEDPKSQHTLKESKYSKTFHETEPTLCLMNTVHLSHCQQHIGPVLTVLSLFWFGRDLDKVTLWSLLDLYKN